MTLKSIQHAATILFTATSLHAQLSQEEFRNPPIQARPSALWTWLNGHVDHKQITRELEEMKAKGMRGAIIWDLGALSDPDKIIPAGPEFLGPESLKSIHHALDEAERLGLEMGIIAASSWNSGGTWITPVNASKALLWSETKVKGPSEFSEVLPLPEKAGKHFEDVAVLAVAVGSNKRLRLDDRLSADGRLNWQVPDGDWSILRFIRNNTGEFLNCPSPNSRGLVIDHLSRDATDAHINHMLDTLSKGRSGFGSLKVLMLDSYEVRPATDWTPDFIKAFSEHHGYDPVPWLPVLTGLTLESKDLSDRFQHDYRKTVSDLLVEDHYARSRELVNRRGLQLLAEAGHGGHARVDPLKALGAADIPMGEFWNHRKNWVTKEAASAANTYGRKLVNCESFTGWQNWQDGPAAYKRLLDVALCAGLNQVTFHTFAHNPPEAGLPGFAYHAGEHFNVNSTWWPYAAPMLADMSRACHMLQQGRFVADVCVYYGDEAPNLVPARRIAPTIKSQWSDDKCAHCGRLQPVDIRSLGHGHDYDYVNEEVLLERMRVRDGRLVLPDGMNYRLLVLPDREAISSAVLRRVGEWVDAGATVSGRRPLRSNSLKGYPDSDREVRELAIKIWGACDGETVKSANYGKGRVFWNVPLDKVLEEMKIAPDFTVENLENKHREIDHIHRETENEDIYLVANTTLEHQSAICRFRVAAGRVPSFWQAEDGSVKPCHVYASGDGFVRLPIELPPASSVFVVFREDERADHLVRLDQTGGAIEVTAMDAKTITAVAHLSGSYAYRTAKGHAGAIKVDVPADIIIDGSWKLVFPPDSGAPREVTMDTLIDWTMSPNPEVRYFSGTATYQKTFTLPDMSAEGCVTLDLGAIREVAAVRVNGKDAGILWKQPFRAEIGHLLEKGENHLEIVVTNLWNNRIVGDLQPDSKQAFTRTNIKSKFSAKSPLLPSGLIGPVKLAFPVSVTVQSL
jgi:hypothetical protein